MRIPLLELSGLTRRFRAGTADIVVLKDINLRIYAGEMVAIIGQSGSGKSTLMNILGCLDRASSGEYRINGREVSTLDNDELATLRRECFGFIFQRYHLLPHLTAEENIEIPAIYAAIDQDTRRSRARELLARLGLITHTTHKPNQLSGGQQQRVSIARALMNGGEVILADEPTGALDSQSGNEVLSILRELHQRGHTIILITHDRQIADHAERIIEIRDGKIVADHPSKSQRSNTLPAVQQKSTAHRRSPLNGELGRVIKAFKMAWLTMLTHRLRTLLTMLGIIIGISSVVSIVALGQGTQQKIIADINAMGTNTITFYPGTERGDDTNKSIKTMSSTDLAVLQQQFYVDSVTPIVGGSAMLRYRNIKANAAVTGVSDHYFRVCNIAMSAGRPFGDQEVRQQAQAIVIDDNTRAKLFPHGENPLGKIVLLDSVPCTIVAVMQKKIDTLFVGYSSPELQVFVPYTTAMRRVFGHSSFGAIMVRIRDGVSNELAERHLIKLLALRHGRKDFMSQSSDSVLKTVKKTTTMLTLFILAVALISLLVGGIGVMNIMLVSVTERAHEIGIRMAVGARQYDILQQFLIEAILVCLIGGALGILLSYGIGVVFSLLTTSISMQPSVLSIVVAFVCCTLTGVIFGFLPARNAARLDPIEALARE